MDCTTFLNPLFIIGLVTLLISISIFYYIIKIAVRNAIKEAYVDLKNENKIEKENKEQKEEKQPKRKDIIL